MTGLREYLDGPHKAARDVVRDGLATHAGLLDAGLRLSRDEYRDQVLATLREVAAQGHPVRGFPKEYGGQGDLGGFIAGFETLAFGDLSLMVKAGVQFGLFAGAILHLGTERHHERYLADALTGDLLGCFAMTETGHGSNVQALETTATYDPATGEFVVHTPTASARKDYIGNAARHGRLAAVFAQLVVGGQTLGVHCLLVPIRTDDGQPVTGVTISDCGPKLGLNGVDNGRIVFDQVRVPREALLDRYAQVDADGTYRSEIENPDRRFFTMLGTLVQGRVSVGGAAINASKVALTIAVRYAEQRRQFGAPGSPEEALLLDYRMHQRRLLPLLARTYALHFAQAELVDEFARIFGADTATGQDGGSAPDGGSRSDEHDRRALEAQAAGTKAVGTWHATETIQLCREACGGAGYLAENRLSTLKADTDVFTTFEGDNTVLLQLVAKGLLTDYRESFGKLDPLGTARFVAGQAVEIAVEKTALRGLIERLRDAVPNRSDAGDPDAGLRDDDYHSGLLRFREQHMLAGVARRLRAGIDAGDEAFEVFNRCQDHVIAAGRAHVERVVLEAFQRAVHAAPEGETRDRLKELYDLHALTTIENDRAWFMEHGRLSGPRSKAITALVNDLCGRVRPHASSLVDAFGVPGAAVDVPMVVRSLHE
ncbi:acyl-CoA oxidase domain protein [Kribbella flavida DSM 17836]|uniref:acyl-CoA oxidase n=1 Tax=Kribbella flavida (strain DSM 17836 / JCM 10339 / NBRC 14399) TaxID=479435 RepID=D2PYC2_KRIFD|nr:acyl-CoA dehydrogenase [Kribbella flavida]ADB35490.1 acyl-CoA oxidase domain protein [Kribbella flavida DSM 17836]